MTARKMRGIGRARRWGTVALAITGTLTSTAIASATVLAHDDSATTVVGRPIDIDVLTNDTLGFALGLLEPLAPTISGAVNHLNLDNTIHYIPADGFSGLDSFDYNITNLLFEGDTGTVAIEVKPVGREDRADSTAGKPVDIDVLANDQGWNLTARDLSRPAHGVLTSNPDGTIRYQPDPTFSGIDEFSYRPCTPDTESGLEICAENATGVTVTVPPDIELDRATTHSPVRVDVPVLANDTGLGLELKSVHDVVRGSAAVRADGRVEFTPAVGAIGTGWFTYRACDSSNLCDEARVAVKIVRPPTVSLRIVGRPRIVRSGTAVRLRAQIANRTELPIPTGELCAGVPAGVPVLATGGGRLSPGRICWSTGVGANSTVGRTFTVRMHRRTVGERYVARAWTRYNASNRRTTLKSHPLIVRVTR